MTPLRAVPVAIHSRAPSLALALVPLPLLPSLPLVDTAGWSSLLLPTRQRTSTAITLEMLTTVGHRPMSANDGS